MNWYKLKIKITFSLFFIIAFICTAIGQNNLAENQQKYPGHNEVITNDFINYNISIVDKKIKVLKNFQFESIILTANGINNNEESITYSEFIRLNKYEAYTIINSNGKEKKVKVTQINEMESKDKGVFFNDVKEKQLIFPSLEAGAKKVYSYESEITDPFLLNKYVFGNTIPVQNAGIEIKVDKNINLGFKIFNDPNHLITFSKTEKGNKIIYKWFQQNIAPIKYESNTPGYLHRLPHISIYIKDYTIENNKVNVLNDLDGLFNYYKGFIKDINKTENIELKNTAIDLTKNLNTDLDKIKAIFYWVKANIKYIAFENGYEGFIPRESSWIFEKKFGDCKDMANIITEMSKFANIPNVYLAWIGTREIPYSYYELATPSVSNHMIAVYKNGSEYLFLDATDKETRFGIPTAFIQGKEALVNENGNYKVVKVPVVLATDNETNEKLNLKIEGTKLLGTGSLKFKGYNRSHLLMQIGDAKEKNRKDIIKNLTEVGNNKFKLLDFTESNMKDLEQPYNVDFNFEIEDYLLVIDSKIYLNLFLEKFYENVTLEKDRSASYEFDFLTNTNCSYELEIPKNYQLTFIPKNLNIENELIKANFVFEKTSTKIILHSNIEIKKLLLEPKDFELWNATIKKLKSNYNETLILEKIK